MAQPITLWRSSSRPQSKPNKSLVWSFFSKLPSQTLSPSSPATTPPADAPPSSLPPPNSKNKRQESGRSSSVRILITVRKDGRALRSAAARTHPLPPTGPRSPGPAHLPSNLPTYLPVALYSTITTYFWWRIHYRVCSIFFIFNFILFFQILHGFRIHPVITLTRKEIPSCPQK
jgi:hypothetical protein